MFRCEDCYKTFLDNPKIVNDEVICPSCFEEYMRFQGDKINGLIKQSNDILNKIDKLKQNY